MLPIRDVNPSIRTPWVTYGIIAAAVYVFFFVQPSAPDAGERFLYAEAAIPCEVLTGEPLTIEEIRTGRCSPDPGPAVFPDKNVFWAIVASIFFHGGFAHLFGNLWVLAIFGNNVEDALGHLRYLIFYLGTGVIAAFGHILLNPGSTVPVVGASGAIAGVMGAYLILYPSAEVVTIVPPFFFLPFVLPAATFLVFWLAGQFLLAGAQTNIAWEAHVAGFLAGMLYAAANRRRFLARTRRTRTRLYPM